MATTDLYEDDEVPTDSIDQDAEHLKTKLNVFLIIVLGPDEAADDLE
jgi:hypothetical protein